MTRAERIEELQLQIQELQIEERIAEWMKANPSFSIESWDSELTDRPWRCKVSYPRQPEIAIGKGNTEADARAHAFSIIFANESAESNEKKGT
jgi:hypothetical protein